MWAVFFVPIMAHTPVMGFTCNSHVIVSSSSGNLHTPTNNLSMCLVISVILHCQQFFLRAKKKMTVETGNDARVHIMAPIVHC
jgi:hypothetical protein